MPVLYSENFDFLGGSLLYGVKMMNDSMLCFTGMGAFIGVLLESMYSGLVACWCYLSMGYSDDLVRKYHLKEAAGPDGNLAAWALWVLMHIYDLVCRAVPLSDSLHSEMYLES